MCGHHDQVATKLPVAYTWRRLASTRIWPARTAAGATGRGSWAARSAPNR